MNRTTAEAWKHMSNSINALNEALSTLNKGVECMNVFLSVAKGTLEKNVLPKEESHG